MSKFRDPQNVYLKQINTQSRPMYTPAVLRLTDSDSATFDVHQRPPLNPTNSSTSISSSSSFRYYWDKLKDATGLSNGKQNIELFDEPSRSHWKPDSSRFSCANCGRVFNYLTETRRKHHCRCCGDLFCGECLLNYIYLDDEAQFTLFGPDWGDDLHQSSGDLNNNTTSNHNVPSGNFFRQDYSVTDINTTTASKNQNQAESAQINNNHMNSDDTSNREKEPNGKHLCKVCRSCYLKYEEYVLDHTTRDHNLGANIDDKRREGRRNTVVDNLNDMPVDWDWSSF